MLSEMLEERGELRVLEVLGHAHQRPVDVRSKQIRPFPVPLVQAHENGTPLLVAQPRRDPVVVLDADPLREVLVIDPLPPKEVKHRADEVPIRSSDNPLAFLHRIAVAKDTLEIRERHAPAASIEPIGQRADGLCETQTSPSRKPWNAPREKPT